MGMKYASGSKTVTESKAAAAAAFSEIVDRAELDDQNHGHRAAKRKQLSEAH